MAHAETEITNRIMLSLSPLGVVVWRNTRGLFYTLDKRRRVRAGLAASGSSDLIGFKKVTVTQDMVGRVLPVFCALEIKTPSGRPSPEQKDFIQFVLDAGGYAGVARSPEDAKKIIGGGTK